jgi:hypothetical protein
MVGKQSTPQATITANAITIFATPPHGHQRLAIQIICRAHPTPGVSVLRSFGLAPCAVGWDGHKVMATWMYLLHVAETGGCRCGGSPAINAQGQYCLMHTIHPILQLCCILTTATSSLPSRLEPRNEP